MAAEFGHGLRHLWHLDREIRFLNHGSFGATPLVVLDAQQEWRLRMEREPVRFMVDELPAAIRAAAAALGAFVGARAEHLAFTFNATEAINAILASIAWQPGDQVVIANHAYPAVRHALDHVARRHGLQVAEAIVPFPLSGDEAIFAAYAAAMSAKTRLVLVDHVFSPLAIISPVRRIVEHCRARGVSVLVDGAHAPGAIPLALDEAGAEWTVGNAHKWLFAAKGCAFLHARDPACCGLHPAVISNFYGAGFPAEFDWVGTHDYTAWCSLPTAIEFVRDLGEARYQAYLRQLAGEAAAHLCAAWQVALPAPGPMFGAMATIPLPGDLGRSPQRAAELRRRLLDEYRIEVPLLPIGDRLWVRISAQVYNELSDYRALADAVRGIGFRPGAP